jgi:hypothetical protein
MAALGYVVCGMGLVLRFAIDSGSVRMVEGALSLPCSCRPNMAHLAIRMSDTDSVTTEVGSTYAMSRILQCSDDKEKEQILRRLMELRDTTNVTAVKEMAVRAINDNDETRARWPGGPVEE